MTDQLTRREALARTGIAGAGIAAGVVGHAPSVAAEPPAPTDRRADFRYCLNTGTIRGHKLTLDKTVDVVSQAGYDGIEPWTGEIARYADAGGSLKDLKKRIADYGLTVESAIGFAPWIVHDDERRKKGFEDAKRDMDLVRQIGGTRIAAPPAGAHRSGDVDLLTAAQRYAQLLELGQQMGVTPQLESWGSSKTIGRLGEVMLVVCECGRPDALILPDVYHMYKGGSDFAGLRMINGRIIQVFHMNDYPADPPRSEITDAHRVYPGDGAAPMDDVIRNLAYIGFAGALSLELFNRDYWQQDVVEVAQTGLSKMKDAVAKALG
jgi:sugar phosphate isomerase/epimerase